MSSHTFPVIDRGAVVKVSELNCDALKETLTKNGYSYDEDDNDDAVIESLYDDSQTFLGNIWEEGVICHKYSYGNDVQGEFVPLIDGEYHSIDVDVDADEWVILCLPTYPSLFKAAYQDKEDLVNRMEALYGKYISKSVNLEERLVTLDATAWG